MERLNLLDKTTQHLSNGYVKLGTSQWTVYQNKASFEGCPDAIKQITDQNDPLNANFPQLSYHMCVNFKDCFIYGFTVYRDNIAWLHYVHTIIMKILGLSYTNGSSKFFLPIMQRCNLKTIIFML